MFLKISLKFFFFIHYRSSLPYSKALCKRKLNSIKKWLQSTDYENIAKVRFPFLYTLQLTDPAGSRPYPGIKVTYPKSDQVCQILCFWVGIPNFCTPGSCWILLAAIPIQIWRSLTQKLIFYVKLYIFCDGKSNFVIKINFWQQFWSRYKGHL